MKSGPRSAVMVWMLLVICGGLILGAMGWLTHGVLQSERERALASARADLEERIRLALWRMDGVASGVTIEENQRAMNPLVEVPDNPYVKVRFTLGRDGQAIPAEACDEEILAKLNELIQGDEDLVSRYQLVAQAVKEGAQQWMANAYIAGNTKEPEGERLSQEYQQELSMKERSVRGKAMNMAVEKAGLVQQVARPDRGRALAAFAAAYQPAWIGGEAFLLREVRDEALTERIEGVWLKTDEFRTMLLGEISDLLPRADLQPSREVGLAADALTLASFPWRLVPGEAAMVSSPLRGAVTNSLIAGWVAVVIALGAGAALVRGIMKLSERRASFVSAVTHELRTPLTTFRLYADMLESGVVTDGAKQASYFRTLRREADRLSHLVENVLAFSRIERRPTEPELVGLVVDELLKGMRQRFEERLAGAGLRLLVDVPEGLCLQGNATEIEHVLFNLIDNAAKYAAGSEPAEVCLGASRVGQSIELSVCDHGPGIAESERREVFRAFHKSAQAAAESRPGVGLGLSLSRRLARGMHGELDCQASAGGACFVLRLPAGSAPSG